MTELHQTPRVRPTWTMVAVVVVAAVLEFMRAPNRDVAWILTVGDLMHAGRHLYSDIIEINPPLIFWFAAGARAYAGVIHSTPETIYRTIVLLLGLGSAISVWRQTADPWLAIVFLVSGLVLVGPDFGQRDVLAAFLIAPYIALIATKHGSRWDWLIGVTAGIGLCLKPFYAAGWLLLLPLGRTRRADVAIVSTGLAYVGAVALFTPSYFPLARILGTTYEAWLRVPWIDRLGGATVLLGLLVAGCGFLAYRYHQHSAGSGAYALATFGCVGALLIQGKPFTYYQQPTLMFGAMASVSFLSQHRRWLTALATTALIGIAAQQVQLWRGGLHESAERVAVTRALARLTMPDNTLFLSEFLFHGPPSFRALARPWRLSMPSLWWLSPAAGNIPADVRSMLVTRVAADIERADMVIVDPATRWVTQGASPLPVQVTADTVLASALSEFDRMDVSSPFVVFARRR